jgi:hypothetical protein
MRYSYLKETFMRPPLLAVVLPFLLTAGLARPNETRTVRLPLKGTDLTYWDAEKRSFVVEPGSVSVALGASSADVRLEKTIEVKEK